MAKRAKARDRSRSYPGAEEPIVVILDASGQMVSWTKGAEMVKGFRPRDIPGKQASVGCPAENDGAGETGTALEIAAEKGRHMIHGWCVREDGSRFWAEVLTTALRDSNGQLRGFAVTTRDATQERQLRSTMAKALEEGEERLHAMLDAAVSAIITIDRKALITYFNRAAQAMFGYASGEVVGRNVSILMPQPYRKEHDGYIANYFRTGIRRVIGIGREIVAMRKDGTVFPIELAVSEIRTGSDLTFTGVIRDITERKRLEKEILAISEREQRRIGQDLHDGLCQQLTGIAFLVQSLQERLACKDAPGSTESAEIAGLLKQSINQARSLSHGLYPVTPQPSGLMLALAELASNTRSIFNIACEFRCPTPVTFTDSAVATHIYRIAQETVQNAIRHGKASRIMIHLSPRPNGWRLAVTDNGVGIPPVGQIASGMGLRSMNHRAHILGAKFSIGARAGGGTRMVCELVAPTKE